MTKIIYINIALSMFSLIILPSNSFALANSFSLEIPSHLIHRANPNENTTQLYLDIPVETPNNLIHRNDDGLSPNIPREVSKELIHDITDSERSTIKASIEESMRYTASKKAQSVKKVSPTQEMQTQKNNPSKTFVVYEAA